MIFFVTYDLMNPDRHHSDLLKKIKNYEGWAKLGDSCFLIKTDKDAVAIRDNLKMGLDSNDKIYIGQTITPAAWYNLPDDVTNWIKSNL